jgi:succinate-acetate transporter protein
VGVITPEQNVRIVVRPIASALPLGFFAFGMGMLLLAGFGNGWLPISDQHTVGLLLAAFVAPLQFTAAIVAFLARDTFGATGLGIFSTSWFATGLVYLTAAPGELSRTLGLYEFGFAFTVAVLAVAAMLGKPLIGTIMLLAASRSALAGAYEWGAPKTVNTAAAWIALAIFVVAVYGGLAFLLEDVRQETVLPVFRRGSSKESTEGNLQDQLRGVGGEAGVRQAL